MWLRNTQHSLQTVSEEIMHSDVASPESPTWVDVAGVDGQTPFGWRIFHIGLRFGVGVGRRRKGCGKARVRQWLGCGGNCAQV